MHPSLLLQSFIPWPSRCPSRSLPIICFLMASAVQRRHRSHVSYCLRFCIRFLVGVIKDIPDTRQSWEDLCQLMGSWGQQLLSWSHPHAWAETSWRWEMWEKGFLNFKKGRRHWEKEGEGERGGISKKEQRERDGERGMEGEGRREIDNLEKELGQV